MKPGPRNLITDVAGIQVGHADDDALISGTTVVLCDEPAVAAVDVRGGAPGTRETDLLRPEMLVKAVDAIVISGGSAYGLDAASGVQGWLRGEGRGFAAGAAIVPIVPGVILFDLLNGGDKDWGTYPPYRELGFAACEAAGTGFELGSTGAGLGATTANWRGGTGSASVDLGAGLMVGALATVNAVGSATIGGGPHFWAGGWEIGNEFGGHGLPAKVDPQAWSPWVKGPEPVNTTPVVVATNARLDQADAGRLAMMAQDGLARALHPVHTPTDGDTVFVLATGAVEAGEDAMFDLGGAAAAAVSRSIARAIYEAGQDNRGSPGVPAYRECHR